MYFMCVYVCVCRGVFFVLTCVPRRRMHRLGASKITQVDFLPKEVVSYSKETQTPVAAHHSEGTHWHSANLLAATCLYHYYYWSTVCERLVVLFRHQPLLWLKKLTIDYFALPLIPKLLYIIPLDPHETYFYEKTISRGPCFQNEKCLPREALWFS